MGSASAQDGAGFKLTHYRISARSPFDHQSKGRPQAIVVLRCFLPLLYIRYTRAPAGTTDITAPTVAGRTADRGDRSERLAVQTLLDRKRSERSRILRDFFGDHRACDVGPDLVRRYVAQRQAEGAAAASIVYSLRLVHRMFTLAIEEGSLPASFPAPHMPTPPVENARRGFFERPDFEKVATLLRSDLADAARFAYLTGWRKAEVTGLEWRDVNAADRTVTLPSERSKTDDARTIGLGGDLLTLIERRRALRRLDCPFVFHRDGKPLGDFRHAWRTACKQAGVAGRLFHNLRRTAVRNLIRANVPERIAMGVTGHKTRAVFDRYKIVDRRDTEHALARVEAYLATQPTETPSVTVLETGTEATRS